MTRMFVWLEYKHSLIETSKIVVAKQQGQISRSFSSCSYSKENLNLTWRLVLSYQVHCCYEMAGH